MTISLIVAATDNHVIGINNELPWHLPEDLKYFKNITWGMPVMMGRKTFEAVGRPLPGRTNIVITSNLEWSAEGVIVANSIDNAILKAAETGAKEIFISGGGEIFKASMKIADRIYITRIHTTLEGDTLFPEINDEVWKLESSKELPADEKNKFDLSFQVWVKK